MPIEKKTVKKTAFISFFSFAVILSILASCGFSQKQIKIESVNQAVEKDTDSLNGALKVQNTLRHISESVAPSVVNIRTTEKGNPQQGNGGNDPFNDFLRKFFGQDLGSNDPSQQQNQDQNDKPQPGSQILGSGFIISNEGYIITNAHVVDNAKDILVQTINQTTYKAKLIGLDTKTDIALIQIKPSPGDKIVSAPLGDSDKIEPGDFAIAIGNPFGLNGTLTFGIISAKGRNSFIEQNAPYKNYIQTDVPVNPGNSGGPLLNIHGQVVGINSAIYSTSGGSIGISFAIPINIAKNVIDQIIKTGHVTRGSIGVLVQPLTDDIAHYNGLRTVNGVVINDVIKGGPAEVAGIQPGDVVISVNGKTVTDTGDFISAISNLPPKAQAKLSIIRNKQLLHLSVSIGNKDYSGENVENLSTGGKEIQKPGTLNWQNMSLMDLSKAREQGYKVPDTQGVVVVNLSQDSKAAQSGVRPGSIIATVNRQPVTSILNLKNIIKTGKSFLVQFKNLNGQGNLFIVLP